VFNGTTDFVSINDTSFDTIGLSDYSVEAVVKFNSFQVNTGSYMRLFDKNGGNTSVGVGATGTVAIWLTNWYSFPNTILSTGIVYKIRIERVNVTTVNLYINDVYKESITVPSWSVQSVGTLYIGNGAATPNGSFNGVYYSFNLKKNGVTLLNYNFINASNIVGSTVLQNAKNLIPSFEDARWSIHANAQVLGKDYLRLNATGVWQTSTIYIDCIPNARYLFQCTKNGQINIANGNDLNTWVGGSTNGIFTTPSNCTKLFCKFENSSAGSFDFIKPQLYALDGNEGTINGAPTQGNKSRKRTLYNKR
jgi:hypothetical protein